MYLILDNDNVWQGSASSLETAIKAINDIRKVDQKIWGKPFTYKVVKEIDIIGGINKC